MRIQSQQCSPLSSFSCKCFHSGSWGSNRPLYSYHANIVWIIVKNCNKMENYYVKLNLLDKHCYRLNHSFLMKASINAAITFNSDTFKCVLLVIFKLNKTMILPGLCLKFDKFYKIFSLSKICTSVWIIQELSECRNFLWDLQSVRLWIHMNNFIFWHKTSFSYFSDILLQMKSFCKNLSRKMKKEIVLRKLLDPHYNNNYLVLEENHSHLGSYFPNVIR